MTKFIAILFVIVTGAILAWWVTQPLVAPVEDTATTTVSTFPSIELSTNPTPQTSLPERVEERYQQFLTDTAAADAWTSFNDNGAPIALPEFLNAMGARIEPTLMPLLNPAAWKLYSCTDTAAAGSRDIVLSMRFALQPRYEGDLYRDQMRAFDAWETSLLTGVVPILYPAEYYPQPPVSAGVFTTNIEQSHVYLREAPIRLPDGSTDTVGYVFVGDELLVGTNIECLLRAQEFMFDTSA